MCDLERYSMADRILSVTRRGVFPRLRGCCQEKYCLALVLAVWANAILALQGWLRALGLAPAHPGLQKYFKDAVATGKAAVGPLWLARIALLELPFLLTITAVGGTRPSVCARPEIDGWDGPLKGAYKAIVRQAKRINAPVENGCFWGVESPRPVPGAWLVYRGAADHFAIANFGGGALGLIDEVAGPLLHVVRPTIIVNCIQARWAEKMEIKL